MADTLRLSWSTDAGMFTGTIDLLNGPLRLVVQGWEPGMTEEGGAWSGVAYGGTYQFQGFGPVAEVLELVGREPRGILRPALVELDAVLERARRARIEMPREIDLVWLEWYLDGEAARRSLVMRGEVKTRYANYGFEPFMRQAAWRGRLGLERHPFWEATEYASQEDTSVSVDGGKMMLTGAGGNVPARIWRTWLYGITGGGGPVGRLWAGIRPRYVGSTAFEPVWDFEDGVNGTDAADAADATAIGGSKVRVSFATVATLVLRSTVSVLDVLNAYGHSLSDWDHMYGRYKVLVRARVSAAGTSCGLQLRYGRSSPTSNLIPYDAVYVDATDWRWYEVPGEIELPPEGMYASDGLTVAMHWFAERLTGSGSLDLDATCLMPALHCLYIDDANIYKPPMIADYASAYLWTTPYDEYRLTHKNGEFADTIAGEWGATNWYLPMFVAEMVVVGERTTSPAIGDSIGVSVAYYPRWRSYR